MNNLNGEDMSLLSDIIAYLRSMAFTSMRMEPDLL